MAPELLSRELGPVGQPADLFSLGAVLLEMAADVDLPYRDAGWMHLRHLYGQPPTAPSGMQHANYGMDGANGSSSNSSSGGSSSSAGSIGGSSSESGASNSSSSSNGQSNNSVMRGEARAEYERRSPELRALIQRLLHRIPAARPTIDAVLGEPRLQVRRMSVGRGGAKYLAAHKKSADRI